jgi:hypothetical protein
VLGVCRVCESESPSSTRTGEGGRIALPQLTVSIHRLDDTLQVRAIHGKDNSYHTAPPPNAIAYPMTTEEVASVVKVRESREGDIER